MSDIGKTQVREHITTMFLLGMGLCQVSGFVLLGIFFGTINPLSKDPSFLFLLTLFIGVIGVAVLTYIAAISRYQESVETILKKLGGERAIIDKILIPFASQVVRAERDARARTSSAFLESSTEGTKAFKDERALRKMHEYLYKKIRSDLSKVGFDPNPDWRSYLQTSSMNGQGTLV